jgi:hypothetical protein
LPSLAKPFQKIPNKALNLKKKSIFCPASNHQQASYKDLHEPNNQPIIFLLRTKMNVITELQSPTNQLTCKKA